MRQLRPPQRRPVPAQMATKIVDHMVQRHGGVVLTPAAARPKGDHAHSVSVRRGGSATSQQLPHRLIDRIRRATSKTNERCGENQEVSGGGVESSHARLDLADDHVRLCRVDTQQGVGDRGQRTWGLPARCWRVAAHQRKSKRKDVQVRRGPGCPTVRLSTGYSATVKYPLTCR